MKWPELVAILEVQVTAGRVTTYAEVSTRAYGVRNLNQPVRSLLRGAANHGYLELTNRVVGVSGSLAELPEGREQQRIQLDREGVSFTADGRVDLSRVVPVVLV